MANYATLKAAIQNVVKTNGNNEITGASLQQTLLTMVNSLGAGYQYMGVTTPTTNPGTPDQNVFYIAATAGTYANFGGLVLADGEIAILKYNGVWSKDSTGTASLEKVNQLGQDLDAFHADVFGGEFEKELTWSNGYIRKNDGGITSSSLSKYTQPFTLKKGEKVTIGTANANICIIGTTNAQSLSAGDFVTVLQVTDNTGNFETHTYTATEDIRLVLCVKWSDYSLVFENVDSLQNRVDGLDDEIERISEEIAGPVRGTDTDFMELDPEYNLFIPTNAVVGKYINGNTGNEATSDSLVASDYIPVSPGISYHISGGVLARYYAFYSADKSYLSGDNVTAGYITQLTPPALAKYVRFTGQLGYYQDIIFSRNPLLPAEFKYKPKENVIIPISISTTELTDVTLRNAGNIIDRSKLIAGAYIDSADGKQKSTSSVWVATDWCDIDPTKKYSWFKIADFYAAFYDDGKNFILGYSTSSRMPNPVTPPANARYARFTINDSTANAFGVYPSQACWVGADSEHRQPNEYKSYSLPKVVFTERELGAENPCDYTGKEIAVFNKILCIGDSLMYGAENVATGSPYIGDKEPLYNIPTFIKKMSGVDTTNAAHSGYSAEQWLAAYADQDLSGHDAVIIQIGVNNWNSWTGADDPAIESFKVALGQIIDFAISQNAYNDGGTLKNKPKVFVATQYPAKSYLGITVPISILNNAIQEVVNGRNDCFLLDMSTYSHSNDNIAFNRGHLTALGYRQVAQDYIGIISKFVNDNLDLFVDVPFAGTPATQYSYSPTQQ